MRDELLVNSMEKNASSLYKEALLVPGALAGRGARGIPGMNLAIKGTPSITNQNAIAGSTKRLMAAHNDAAAYRSSARRGRSDRLNLGNKAFESAEKFHGPSSKSITPLLGSHPSHRASKGLG